jgi:recombination endonuclease VII
MAELTGPVKAQCPDCGKVLPVSPAGYFPRHRRPTSGTCVAGPASLKVRKRDLVHDCKRCRALEPAPVGVSRDWLATHGADPDAYRPPVPRPLKARGYCASHLRDVQAEERERARDQRRAKHYGLTPERFAELVAAQGGACACGFTHARSRTRDSSAAGAAMALAVDHDHARQAQCVVAGRHGPETACEHCVRGALGRRCNREIIGRFTSTQLRRLADYMDDPTAKRLGWWDDPTDGMTDDEQEN